VCALAGDEVKSVEHFTENTEKGGGHGEVVPAVEFEVPVRED
jgi:hypothetical protein